jgi:sterol desaturase/sphingolipid hydroxylase (fatty acid hydroxylase superfamily)
MWMGFAVGLLASNAAEWFLHRRVLHELGRDKKGFWSFHWHEHHREARRNGFLDPHYQRSPLGWHSQGKELAALVGVAAAVTPLWPLAPGFVLGSYFSAWRYYRLHKRAHLDPAWAREHLPWHYDHHMGPNQDANWCVTHPLWDHVMGTRIPYVGTERERQDRARAAARDAVPA